MRKHRWAWCPTCECLMIICGVCGNNCCNATYGFDGQCTDCLEAYKVQESYMKNIHKEAIFTFTPRYNWYKVKLSYSLEESDFLHSIRNNLSLAIDKFIEDNKTVITAEILGNWLIHQDKIQEVEVLNDQSDGIGFAFYRI